MTSRSHLLYLEDDLADVELLQDALKAEGLACDITPVDTQSGFLAALQRDGFDLILADYTLPSFDGLSALRMARQQKPDLPFIFVSGTMGEVEANDAFLRLMGYSREEQLSGEMCWTDLTPPEWLDHDERLWVPKLKMTGSLQPFEQEYRRKDGSRVPVLIGAASFDESVNRGVAFVLDLTERKRAEEALAGAKESFAMLLKLFRLCPGVPLPMARMRS